MRLSGFLGELAATHDVACCAPRLSDRSRAHLGTLGVEAVPAEGAVPSIQSALRDPMQVAAFSAWRVPSSLLREADVIHLSTVRAVPMVRPADLERAHLDYVDALGRNTYDRGRYTHPRLLWHREARRLREFEIRVGTQARSSSCTSEADRVAIGLASIAVVPFGVRIPNEVPEEDPSPTLLFPGNLGYFANVDAARWLATAIFPRVRSVIPNTRLLVVGARPRRQVRALAGQEGVEVHANVPDMTPFFGRAWAVAAPLRYGTGLQTKVLEAFAHCRPVVTTTAVASRVPGVVVRKHLEAADDASSLAQLLVGLLQDSNRRRLLADEGLRIAASLSWRSCATSLVASYRL